MRPWTALIFGLALPAAGCSEAPAPDTGAAVSEAPETRTVDTLLLTLDLRVPADAAGALGAHPDAPLDPAHVVAVALEVDGQPWGRFAVAAEPADGEPVQGWRLLDAPQSLLLVAHLTDDQALLETPPADVGGWLSVLARTLTPGDHVARVAEVVLASADGARHVLHPQGWLPFTVAIGDASAHIADLTLTAHGIDAEAP